MRLLTFLLMSILPVLAFSQRTGSLKKHPFDTLSKYSYLLVSLGRDKQDNQKTISLGIGTGFFIRRDQKLYLISAKHVFTNCEVYGPDPRRKTPLTARPDSTIPIRIDTPFAVQVWYKDTLGRTAARQLPIADWKRQSKCLSAFKDPDVDTMDVTKYFLDGQINSIDSLMPDSTDRYILWPGERIVAYGYSDEPADANTFNSHPNLTPHGYLAHGHTIPQNQTPEEQAAMSTAYFATKPGLPQGVSGAPVFRVSSGGSCGTIVEFIGIQSGAKPNKKSGYIAQRIMLLQCYHLK